MPFKRPGVRGIARTSFPRSIKRTNATARPGLARTPPYYGAPAPQAPPIDPTAWSTLWPAAVTREGNPPDVPFEPVPALRRNLCYFAYPVRESNWKWHVDMLRAKSSSFTGKRVAAIATDARTVPFKEAKDAFSALGFEEVLSIPNNPGHAESAAFIDLIGLVKSDDPSEITFYAHTKGVSHPAASMWTPHFYGWARTMYELCLSDPALIDRIMKKHDAVGCFQLKMPHSGSPWHYAGTYFWFKNRALFAGDWKKLEKAYYSTEAYIGRRIHIERAFCLTGKIIPCPLPIETYILPKPEIDKQLAHIRKVAMTW